MKTKDHGGPAFPVYLDRAFPKEGILPGDVLNVEGKMTMPGMTLRDYFAAKVLQGLATQDNPPCVPEAWARDAYQIADAMLKERVK